MPKIKAPMWTAPRTAYPELRTRQRTDMRRDLLGRPKTDPPFE